VTGPLRHAGGRLVRRVTGRPSPTRARSERDPFAAFRSLDGPRLLDLPAVRHDPELDGQGRLVVLLPHLEVGKMSGGPNTVLQLAARLIPAGVRVRCVAVAGGVDDRRALVEHLRAISGVDVGDEDLDVVAASGRTTTLSVGWDDVPLATYWTTAHLANAILEHVHAPAFLSFVQDYEAAFYPWSSKAALVEATYRMPVRAIVNSPFLAAWLDLIDSGLPADPLLRTTFLPAVDRAVFRPRPRPAGTARRLIVYARPRNPRNLFELALAALRRAVAAGVFAEEPWEFLAIGQELPDLPLTDRVQLVAQPWLGYAAYGELLASADILLSLMHSPHPSYPPLEMAATGGEVVTTTFGPKTASALRELSPRIHGVTPDIDALVAGLASAVEVARTRRVPGQGPGAADELRLPASWDEALAGVVPWAADQVIRLRGGA
jgi:O-antigen biosynthesis protein